MKNRLNFFYPLTFVLVVFTIALFSINTLKEKNRNDEIVEEKKQEEKDKYQIDYKADQTIRIKMTKTDEIIAMDINDYLRGVVPSEMSPTYNIEALKAQAVVARTYTYRKMQSGGDGSGGDMCDSFAHCQAFYTKDKLFEIWRRKYSETEINENWKKINQAVVETQNEVITHNGQMIKAFFHASSPIKTENIDQIWGGEKLSYLVSVENEEFEDYENRTSIVEISFDEAVKKLKEDDKTRKNINTDMIKNACINENTTSGRVKNVKFGEYIVSAEKLRTIFGLKSTDFKIEIKEASIVFNVTGYGHGVGMSQVGANYYASQGMDYKEIIKHYYTGVEIIKLN